MYYNILLTIHIIVTFTLIITILMQRSASDGMALSGSSSSSFLSGRAAARGITQVTSILAALFICTSLGLGIITTHNHPDESSSILERIGTRAGSSSPLSPTSSTLMPQPSAPAPAATVPAPAPEPAKPSVPRPE